MIRFRTLASLLVCLPVLLVSASLSLQQPDLPRPTGSKTWVGHYQEVEEYLRTAECVRIEELRPGNPALTRCTLRPGGPVGRMAWHPMIPGAYRGFKESYKAEIAAYEFDKLLNLDMVPPTVERELQGLRGSATFWVENVVGFKAAGPSPSVAPSAVDTADWNKQLVRMKMFDNLIGTLDRNLGNTLLVDKAWNVILIDHTRAFRLGTEFPHNLNRIDGDFWGKVQGLTRKQLDATLGPWLDEDQITAILDRREKMKAEINRLIAERGADAVFLR